MSQYLKFNNGENIEIVTCRGGEENFRGSNRDVLSFFVDPQKTSLNVADEIFSAQNCETVELTDEEKSYLHNGYTERVSITKGDYFVDGYYQNLICVKMGKKSEAEELRIVVDDLLIEVLGV